MSENETIEDVESTLRAIGKKMQSDFFVTSLRNILDRGLNATYTITMKKQSDGIFCVLELDERVPRNRNHHFLHKIKYNKQQSSQGTLIQ